MIGVGWLASWLPMVHGATEQTARKTRNVILITTDGLRCQELFTGAAAELLNKEIGGVENTNALRQAFWRETPEARREALMPFFWSVVARQGQVCGNADKSSVVTVTNHSGPCPALMLAIVPGNSSRDDAKIGGITPDVLSLSGRCEDCPSNMRLPTCRLGY